MRRLLPIALFATVAGAQEFGLDLSEEKPPATPPEFRPVLGVLSVKAADAEEVSASRARQLEAELLKQLAQGDLFQTVLEPSAVRQQLGAGFEKAEACTEYACMDATAKQLKVQRLVRLTVQKQGPGSLVTMYGFDPGFNEVLTVSQESGEKAEKSFLGVAGKSQAQKDREFLKKINSFLVQVQRTLSIPNGKIIIDNADPSAVVLIDGIESGIGSTEVIAPRGLRLVKVTAAGYKPFEQSVTVVGAQELTVKVSLEALPIEPVVVAKPAQSSSGGLLTKPSLYMIIAGAVAVGIGVGFGQSANSIKSRLADGGDPVSVTRAEAKRAPQEALAANILVGAGAAAILGGTAWIILTPTPGSGPVQKTGPGEPTESVSPGATLSFGGSF